MQRTRQPGLPWLSSCSAKGREAHMATVDSLRTHLVEELADLLDAEEQLTRALPKLADAATSKPLKGAFQKHLKETRTHVTRIKDAMRELGERPTSKTCEGMQGLLDEGETMVN